VTFWTYLAQIVNFLIFIAVLHYLLYKPVTRMMKRRREEIESDLAQAEEKRKEAEKLREEAEERERELEDKRDSVLREAREQARHEREEIMQRAEEDARDRLKRFRRVMQQERDDLLDKVIDDLRETIVEVAASVLEDASSDLLDRSIRRVDGLLDGLTEDQVEQAREAVKEDGAVKVRAAGGLDDDQEKRIAELIEKKLSVSDFEVEAERDDSLLAGMEVTIGNLQLEAHWRSRIDEALKERQMTFDKDARGPDKGEQGGPDRDAAADEARNNDARGDEEGRA